MTEGHRKPSRMHRSGFAAIVALITGGAVYLLTRSPRLVMFDWVAAAGLTQPLAAARSSWDWDGLPGWLVYSAPAACWAFALAIGMGIIWWDLPRARWAALTVAVCGGLGHEWAQLVGRFNGTFDLHDILAYLLGYSLAVAVLHLEEQHANALHPHDLSPRSVQSVGRSHQ